MEEADLRISGLQVPQSIVTLDKMSGYRIREMKGLLSHLNLISQLLQLLLFLFFRFDLASLHQGSLEETFHFIVLGGPIFYFSHLPLLGSLNMGLCRFLQNAVNCATFVDI